MRAYLRRAYGGSLTWLSTLTRPGRDLAGLPARGLPRLYAGRPTMAMMIRATNGVMRAESRNQAKKDRPIIAATTPVKIAKNNHETIKNMPQAIIRPGCGQGVGV